MGRLTHLSPDRPIGERLPIVNYIRIGLKQVGTFPTKLDEFEVCLPQQDPSDRAGNRLLDSVLQKKLLERQAEIAPELPSDKLRAIEVFTAPIADDKIFNSDFLCWHQWKVEGDDGKSYTERECICRGDCRTATWLPIRDAETGQPKPRKLFPGLRVVTPAGPDGVQIVECRGQQCPLHARVDAGGKQVYPRCGVEWSLLLQIRHANTGAGLALYHSGSASGVDQVESVIRQLEALNLPGGIGGVPMVLRLKNEKNKHGKTGAWVAYLDWQGQKLALVNAIAQERGLLQEATKALGMLPAATRFELAEAPRPAGPPVDAPARPERADDPTVEGADDEGAVVDAEYETTADDAPVTSAAAERKAAAENTPAKTDQVAPAQSQDAFTHIRQVAAELAAGDPARAGELIEETRLALQTDDPEFPAPQPGWTATPDQVGLFEDLLRLQGEKAA